MAIAASILFVFLCSCASGERTDQPAYEPDTLVVTFEYEKQSGYASNQFAVWIEDMDGKLIKTLYATRFTVGGGYKDRPESIPTWAEKAGLASMEKSETDAVSGATPKIGTLSYTWDLTDKNGGAVALGEYRFIVEGSLRWKNRVVYSGAVDIGGAAVTVQAGADFVYEASGGQAALTEDSPENNMIGAVTASFAPAPENGPENRRFCARRYMPA
jgi:hypothetical protein